MIITNLILTYGWTLLPLLVVYWVLVIAALIAMDREPTVTIAWILVICLLPGIGLVLYYFTGRNWRAITQKSKWHKARQSIRLPFMQRLFEHYEPLSRAFFDANPHQQIERLVTSMWNQTAVPALPARDVEVFFEGATYFPRLLEDLSNATRSIHMQYFIWEDDALCDRIAQILVERLERGVEVRILNDFFGCMGYSKRGLRRVQDAGGTVLSDITALKQANYRNHRKITVIDGMVAHTGGVNIGQEYIDGGPKYSAWRDCALRFKGPAVLQLQDLFCQRWFEVDHESLWLPRYFPIDEVGGGDTFVQVAAQGVEDRWQVATDSYRTAIGGAKDYVWIQSPYYVPTDSIHDALIAASFAGVDVRLMITGVPDKRIAWDTAFTYFGPLIEAGVRIYLYEPGFLHAKMLVTDDIACAIGSMNLDYRSLKLHKELMIWMYDRSLALQCKQAFTHDQAQCHRVALADLADIGASQRFRNSLYRLLSRLL